MGTPSMQFERKRYQSKSVSGHPTCVYVRVQRASKQTWLPFALFPIVSPQTDLSTEITCTVLRSCNAVHTRTERRIRQTRYSDVVMNKRASFKDIKCRTMYTEPDFSSKAYYIMNGPMHALTTIPTERCRQNLPLHNPLWRHLRVPFRRAF